MVVVMAIIERARPGEKIYEPGSRLRAHDRAFRLDKYVREMAAIGPDVGFSLLKNIHRDSRLAVEVRNRTAPGFRARRAAFSVRATISRVQGCPDRGLRQCFRAARGSVRPIALSNGCRKGPCCT